MLIFSALRQAAKWGRILRVSKVTCLGFAPKARETAKQLRTPHSRYHLSAVELEQTEVPPNDHLASHSSAPLSLDL